MSAVLKVQRPGVWFTLYLVQMGWMVVAALYGFRLAARRKKKAAL